MSTTGTEVDEIPSDTTPEFQGQYLYEEEAELEEEEEDVILVSEDFVSGPFLSDKCTVPFDILEMDYSYGYDCKRYFNIVAPDEDTIVFIGGNLIHFYDVPTRTLTFRRSYLGGGLGHITVNPNSDYPHLAVAENGDNPPIMIYEWPSMEIVGILKEGAAKRYAHINYSPDGEMMVSQSYGPDFLITVWQWKNWRRSPIILRIKSHVQDVYRCMFSPYVPGHITTGGAGHIKFWKMAQTFTGLKLQGELGRFGKTEISDIIGIYPMPDEKVISGTEWGNLLVWEAGLIKLEVLRTLRRRCHNGPVLQLEFNRTKGEIWSISEDGWLRAWEYRVIDEADPPDEDRVVQMLPSYEREIPDVHFSCICKKHIYEPEDMFYYAQDSNGGIWLVDLVLRGDYEPAQQLLASHAGHVTDLAPCPWGPFLASIGESGKLLLYNYEERKVLHQHKFPARGTAMIWFPLDVDTTGSYFLGGFDDGVIRLFTINFQMKYVLKVIQSVKPHNKPVSVITLNNSGSLFVSGGEDHTIFLFEVRKKNTDISLAPIGFIPLAATPTCFTWNPGSDTILLVGCQHGELYEFDLPIHPLHYTKISYLLHTIKPVKQRFTTCKAQIRRDLYLKSVEERKSGKLERKKQEIIKIKEANPGLEVDEEAYLQDSESEEVLEPLHIPEVPNPIYFTQYTPEDTIWLSMGGYDAGYIYEYHMDQKQQGPLKATMIADCDDIEMYGYIYSPDGNYVITSMQNGSIRINRINPDDFRDLSDYWLLSMHDNFKGRITKMCFSYDNSFFFSAGEDGNIFSYKYKPEVEFEPPNIRRLSIMLPSRGILQDESYESLSLEEMMIKAEEDKQMKLANEHKRKLRQRLKELTGKLTSLLDRNCKLPKSQRYPLRDFIVDDRIMKALDDMLEDKVALEKRKLAFDVEKSTIALEKMKRHYTDILDRYPITVTAINTNHQVNVIILRGIGELFNATFKDVMRKVEEEKLKGRLPPRKEIKIESKIDLRTKAVEIEPFLVGLSPSTIAFKLGAKLTRKLNNYRERKRQRELRQEEWNRLYECKPVEGVNHPDDVKALDIAAATIGDFKLKSAPKYRVPSSLRESTVTKYQQLLETKLRACKYMVSAFNDKVIALRNKKLRLIQQLESYTAKINQIHQEIPECRIKNAPPIPVITDADFPEKELQVKLTVDDDFQEYFRKLKPQKSENDTCEGIDWEKEALGIANDLPDIPGSSRDIIYYISNQSEKEFSPFNKKIPNKEDFKESVWEREIKCRRLLKKLHEQETLIDKMHSLIAKFDEKVKKLSEERFMVSMSYTLLDLHILVLNQELIIVKEFEIVEDELGEIALQKWSEMMDMRDDMKRVEMKIESHNYNIENAQEQIKVIQQTFLTAAKDNKFWDFLRRIFKKKYRPPKLATDDSESSSESSSSSSESEEDDTGSLDSRDIGPIRLDESICPKGCDRELYDYTFTLRSRRHDQEKLIAEEKKSIESCKKDLEQAAKRMKVCDLANKNAQDELEKYQTLKQNALNEVNCLVVLKLSQLRHLNPDGFSVAKLPDTLIFGEQRLTDLYNRVTELQMETLEERNKHRKNKIHLHRMTVDCHFMDRTIARLKKEITEKMIIKFGSRVKIEDIEESMLKRMILNLRIRMLNLGAAYENEIDNLRKIYGEKQIEVKNIIRENTARLQVLALLNKEKSQLAKLLELQARSKTKAKSNEDLYFIQDIDKLNTVVKSQQEQIQLLKSEIKMLTTKSLPPKPIPHEIEETLPEEPELPVLVADYGSLEELYEPPKELIVMPSVDQQEATDEEIVLCIHELMKEVVDAVVETDLENTEEQMVIKILAEIVEQVPLDYLGRETSLEYIAGLIKDIISDVTKVESETIIKTVSKTTSRSIEEIAGIVESILSKIGEN